MTFSGQRARGDLVICRRAWADVACGYLFVTVAGSAEVRVSCVPLRLFLAIRLYPSPFIGGQQHAIHRRPARRGGGALNAARVIVHARPRPLLRPAYQPCLHGIPMNILYL
jgi:hypothetical protein